MSAAVESLEVSNASRRRSRLRRLDGLGLVLTLATLAFAYASGLSLVQAMRVSNAAAGVVVSKVGIATVEPAELLRELSEAEENASAEQGALRSLAETLALTVDRVSVKFKTAEKVGPVGEGRSAEAQAIVTVEKQAKGQEWPTA